MKIILVLMVLLFGTYGCYKVSMPSVTIHYKLTLTVDDNGRQYAGSSVVEVFKQDTTKVFGNSFGGFGGSYKGEAVAVDMGEKGVLFALLRSRKSIDYPLYILVNAFKQYFNGLSVVDDMRALKATRPHEKTELAFEDIPMLVRFRDINDPKTVELVEPDDMEKYFGKGVKLVSARLEVTDEPVTKLIEEWLPWIREYYDTHLDGDRYSSSNAKNRLANDLASGDFAANMKLSKYE